MKVMDATQARDTLARILNHMEANLKPKEREAVIAKVEADVAALGQWMQGRTAMPAAYNAPLNFLGRHTSEHLTVFDPEDTGHLCVWGLCGCVLRVSPLCRVGIDHRANAHYEAEVADKVRAHREAEAERAAGKGTLQTALPKEAATVPEGSAALATSEPRPGDKEATE